MRHLNYIAPAILLAGLSAGCTATHHAEDLRAASEGDRVTVGTVQKEITLGMSAASVAAALGSPNIVTSDDEHQETWIYDKISSEVTYSRSSGTIVGLIFAGSAGGAAAGSMIAGASSTSQRTLTVIIKFDADDKVLDFSYHSSRF